jgi:hypothetical protein
MQDITTPLHLAIHQVFENDTTIEKLKRIVAMDRSALRYREVKDLLECLNDFDNQGMYKEECMKRGLVLPKKY